MNDNAITIIKSIDGLPQIIAGYASVPIADKESQLIPLSTLDKAFKKFMQNDKTRNVMWQHSSLQMGEVLPELEVDGKIYKSGVDKKGLFVICKLRDDLDVVRDNLKLIGDGHIRAFSIHGRGFNAIPIMQNNRLIENIPRLEIDEITLCEKGINPEAKFEIMKSDSIDRLFFDSENKRIVIKGNQDDEISKAIEMMVINSSLNYPIEFRNDITNLIPIEMIFKMEEVNSMTNVKKQDEETPENEMQESKAGKGECKEDVAEDTRNTDLTAILKELTSAVGGLQELVTKMMTKMEKQDETPDEEPPVEGEEKQDETSDEEEPEPEPEPEKEIEDQDEGEEGDEKEDEEDSEDESPKKISLSELSKMSYENIHAIAESGDGKIELTL